MPTNSLMLEEAFSAAECVAAQLATDEDRYADLGLRITREPPISTVTVARGSSDHAATYLSYLNAVRGGTFIASLPMSLVTLYHAPLATRDALAIAISQSGRSPDLQAPIDLYRQGGARTVALVNDVESPLAKAAQWSFGLYAGSERSVAATKSFICSLVAAARFVGHWRGDDELLDAVHGLPEDLSVARGKDWSHGVQELRSVDRILVIGRGPGLSIAQEAALKFKEACGIQAEAFSGAEVKHGPMALVEAGYPMIIFAPRGAAQTGLVSLADEMRARGARVLLAAPAGVPGRQLTLHPASTPDLDPLTAIQSFYPMVEALARERGLDPDKPRHLNKVTTTL